MKTFPRNWLNRAVQGGTTWALCATSLLLSLAGLSAAEPSAVYPRWDKNWAIFTMRVARGDALADDLAFQGESGIYVAAVAVGSELQKAGLRRGDIVLNVSAGKQNTTVSLRILRGKEEQTIRAKNSKEEVPFPPELADDSAQRAAPKTIVVDSRGGGDFRTITGALAAARSGDTVEIRDGIYRECVIVPAGVSLLGSSAGCSCLESDWPVRVFGVTGISLRNLTLRAKFSGVTMRRGKQISLSNCTISATEGDGVALDGADEAVIENCRITGPQRGVRLEKVKARISRSIITRCKSGIMAMAASQLDLTECSLNDNADAVSVSASQCTIENNVLAGLHGEQGTGLTARQSQITLRGNTLRRFRLGVEVRESDGEIQGNTLLQNGMGIWLRGGTLSIRDNTLLLNTLGGIFLSRHVFQGEESLPDATLSAQIIRNTISNTDGTGIVLLDKSQAEIDGNLLEGNSQGIEINDSKVTILNNTIVLQKGRGLEVKGKSQADVFNNVVAFNFWGIVVDTNARWEHGFNNVFGNIASRRFPLEDANYVRLDRLPLANGEKMLVHIYPAEDLAAETDVRVDPKFVRTGKDYHLAAFSPLANHPGKAGRVIGAFGVSTKVADAVPRAMSEMWQGKLTFGDAEPAPSARPRPAYAIKPWEAGERQQISEFLALLQEKTPGLFQRVVVYRPIWLLRTDHLPGSAAAGARQTENSIVFSDFALRGFEGDERLRAVAHELVHLADAAHVYSSSAAWRGLAEPRMRSFAEALRKKGLKVKNASMVRGEAEMALSREHGLPTPYAASNTMEALAECVAHLCYGNYTPPPEIRNFLEKMVLSMPFVPDPAITLAHRARVAEEEGRTADAIRLYSDALAAAPQLSYLYLYRANLYRDGNDLARAIADYGQAAELCPSIFEAWLNRGICRMRQANAREAVADYTRALDSADTPADMLGVYLNRGSAWRELGEPQKAIDDATQAVQLQPKAWEPFYVRAGAFSDLQQWDKAIADFSQVIDLSSGIAVGYMGRAEVFRGKRAYDKAIADLDELLKRQPGDAAAHELRARCRLDMDDEASALQDLNQSVRQVPPTAANVSLYSLLAELLATAADKELRDGPRAVEIATRACELTEWKSVDSLQALAAACAEKGDFVAAMKWQTKAVELAEPERKPSAQTRQKMYQGDKPFRRKASRSSG
jgi:parallel beta-helix repeat protein